MYIQPFTFIFAGRQRRQLVLTLDSYVAVKLLSSVDPVLKRCSDATTLFSFDRLSNCFHFLFGDHFASSFTIVPLSSVAF